MGNAIPGVGQRRAVTANGERDALQARARLHLDIVKAATRNKTRRDAENAELVARNLVKVEGILAQLKDLDDTGGALPPKSRWREILAQLKSVMLRPRVRHGRVGLQFPAGGAG